MVKLEILYEIITCMFKGFICSSLGTREWKTNLVVFCRCFVLWIEPRILPYIYN